MDFNQSEKLLGKMIAIMMIVILVVVSISVLKFMGFFSLINPDSSNNDLNDHVSETSYVPGNVKIAVDTSSTASTVNEVDPRPATDSRFYGTPGDIRGREPPEELGYPVYNKIFEDSLIFEYSNYAYEISLADNPLIISFTVDPIQPSVIVESDSVHSGNVDSGGGSDDDCPDCIYPIGSPYECFLKITVTDPETDEFIYSCGYSGDYSSNLYQWHLIPDHIDRARVDLEGNNIGLDLKIGAGRCEDPESSMIIYRGYECSPDAHSDTENTDEFRPPGEW